MLFRKAKREEGVTLVELIVVIVMLAIISPLVMWFFWATINNFIRVQSANLLVSNETRALSRMEQVIRSGTQIDNASATSLTIYAYFSPADSTLSKVTYTYNASQKLVTVERIPATGTAPNYTYNVANKVTSTILSGVTLKNNLFSYEDASGGTGPFDSSTFQNIKIVTIDIYGVLKGNTAPTEVKSSVLIRNRRGNF